MVFKPLSQNNTISSEDGEYRLAINSDGSINVNTASGDTTAVTVADGADVALGATTDDAYTGTEPFTAMSALRAIANAAISTDPQITGAVYNSTLPTITNGGSSTLQFDANGNLRVLAAYKDSASNDTVSSTLAWGITPSNQTSTRAIAVAGHNWDGTQFIRQRANTVANGGALLTEVGPYSVGRATADAQIKGSAGFIHTVTIAPVTATPTAGLLTIYNSTTETGTVVYSEWVFATTPGHTVTLDVPCSTGIYVGFDGSLANVQVTVAYR